MEFTVLGSGTHFPDSKKRSAGYLLRDGKNFTLFDFGYGTLLRLVELGVRYQDIRNIFFTHLHEDHYLDLLPFLNTMKIQVAQWGLSKRTIRLFGPRGLKRKLMPILRAVGIMPTRHVRVEFQEMRISRVKVGSVRVHSHPVRHMKDIHALCYRIEKGKRVLAYTGDLDFDESIIPFLKRVHTLVIECGFPNQMKIAGHLTPREAGMIAQAAGVKRVVLTHRYPPCDRVNAVRQCRKEFSGEVALARDMLTLKA